MLGFEPAEQGDYFVKLRGYLRQSDPKLDIEAAERQELFVVNRTWRAKDYPLVAAWLKANEKPLRFVVEASR